MFCSYFANKSKIFLFINDISKCVYLNNRPSFLLVKQRSNTLFFQKRLITILSDYNVSKINNIESINHIDSSDSLYTKKSIPTVESTQALPEKTQKDLGSIYLENLYSYSPKNWTDFLTNAADKKTILSLLTNFQRYVRHLKCKDLLYVVQRCVEFDIRENNERIDVQYVLLCEILYNFLYKNDRTLSIKDICKLTKLINKLKFNKEITQNEDNTSVPICSKNFEYSKQVLVCDSCKSRYGDLLNLSGNDMVTLLMVLLGKSLISQSRDLKRLHENSVVPYLITVGNRNCTLCSHLVRNICSVYYNQFITTNSIHNISILLHTIKRTKARVKPFTRKIIERLVMEDEGLEYLLDRERSIDTRIVSISQIIQFCINTNYTNSMFNKQLDLLMCRLVKYTKELFDNFDEVRNSTSNLDSDLNSNIKFNTNSHSNVMLNNKLNNNSITNDDASTNIKRNTNSSNNDIKSNNKIKIKTNITYYPNLISQLNLLNKCSQVERHNLNRLLIEYELKKFLDSLQIYKPTFSTNDFKTSNTHVQVNEILKSFNYDTLLEHYLVPYVVDIFIPSKNVIIEVDGPYHYATTINERINKMLKRNVESYGLYYTLNSILKKRLLTKSGYKFINIPYYNWPDSYNEQVYYVSNIKM